MPKRKRSGTVSTHYTKVKRIRKGPARRRRDAKRAKNYRSKKITLPKYGFMPDKVCCRLKATSEPFTIDPGTGGVAAIAALKFNTPQAGFNGRQPREWDEMIALYGRCYVIGAKITVESIGPGSITDTKCIWGMHTRPQDYEAGLIAYPNGLTYADITEDHRLMKGTRRVSFAYRENNAKMSKKWSAKKWSGTSDYLDDNADEIRYSTSAADCDSSYEAVCNLWLVNRTNTDSAAVDFNASIEYICVFTKRAAINPST